MRKGLTVCICMLSAIKADDSNLWTGIECSVQMCFNKTLLKQFLMLDYNHLIVHTLMKESSKYNIKRQLAQTILTSIKYRKIKSQRHSSIVRDTGSKFNPFMSNGISHP